MFSPKNPTTLNTPKFDILEYLKQAMLEYKQTHNIQKDYNDDSVRKEFLQFLNKHETVIGNMSKEDLEKLKKQLQSCLESKRKSYCIDCTSGAGYMITETYLTATVICINRVGLKALGEDLKKMRTPEDIEKHKSFWKKLVG